MKWFDQWFAKKTLQAWNSAQQPMVEKKAILGGTVSWSNDIESDQCLNILVRQAIGGKIVSFRSRDLRNDCSSFKHYVIPEDCDFEKELGKLITLESMRQ